MSTPSNALCSDSCPGAGSRAGREIRGAGLAVTGAGPYGQIVIIDPPRIPPQPSGLAGKAINLIKGIKFFVGAR